MCMLHEAYKKWTEYDMQLKYGQNWRDKLEETSGNDEGYEMSVYWLECHKYNKWLNERVMDLLGLGAVTTVIAPTVLICKIIKKILKDPIMAWEIMI